jgi:GT2 family glycosyltransferase
VTPLPAPSDSLSVVVPERGSPRMLDECLTSLQRALARLPETARVIIVVNGVQSIHDYSDVRRRHGGYRFIFYRKPLGFTSAISQALRYVTSGWTYLLNSDALLDQEALSEVLKHRASDVFSVASRLVPVRGSSSKETNYTAIQMIDGLVNLVELDPPPGEEAAEHAYSGGGSSLFQTHLLRVLAQRTSCYNPFYWEDAEWGMTARTLGLRCLFAPESRVEHQGRATVSRFYRASEIDRIFERNRIQFQLRCLPYLDLEPIRLRIMNSPSKTVLDLLHPARLSGISTIRSSMGIASGRILPADSPGCHQSSKLQNARTP